MIQLKLTNFISWARKMGQHNVLSDHSYFSISTGSNKYLILIVILSIIRTYFCMIHLKILWIVEKNPSDIYGVWFLVVFPVDFLIRCGQSLLQIATSSTCTDMNQSILVRDNNLKYFAASFANKSVKV